jgi:uncharacterized glyoxalase superfamily protein PhnB
VPQTPGSDAALFAYLSYRDAPAALEWLTAVGFEVVARQDGPHDAVLHAEVRLGAVVLMIASADGDYDIPALRGQSTGNGLYLHVAVVDELYEGAVAAGARPVFAPEDTEWGTRRARVLDPEGHEWSVGNYEPGQL